MDICVDNANRAIFNAANSNPQYAGMGTTLVRRRVPRRPAAAGPRRRFALLPAARAAGSRRSRTTIRCCRSRSTPASSPPSRRRSRRNKNLVTRAVGVEDTVLLETHQHDVMPGDIYLLCSDGLSDMVDDESDRAAVAELRITAGSRQRAGRCGQRRRAERIISPSYWRG